MKQSLILVDTCAWIDFFRNVSGVSGGQLATLIETDRAAITGVVAAELLQGAKTEKERQTLEFVFELIAVEKCSHQTCPAPFAGLYPSENGVFHGWIAPSR